MTIKRDLSDLPTPATLQDHGRKPDPEPRFVHLLVQSWVDADPGPKPRAHKAARFRHSDAGKCARAVAYAALDVPPSNPMDLSGYWNTGLGTRIHEMWQDVIAARFPEAELEPKVLLGSGAGHIDAVVPLADRKVVIELKSTGGFAYKLAIGERGTAQGPKFEHIVQGALNAKAQDADELVICYLSKEAISVAAADRKGFSEVVRFAAEWTFTRDEYQPYADAEVARIDGILALLDEGTLPARKIPDPELPPGHVITDPTSGQWQVHNAEGGIIDAGSWWSCLYCGWQDKCAATSAGRQPTAEVAVTLGIEL